MTKCACASINIDLVMRQIQRSHCRHRYDREGFIDLIQVNFPWLPIKGITQFADRANWRRWKVRRRAGIGGMTYNSSKRSKLMAIRFTHACENNRSGPIRYGGRIRGRYRSSLAKSRSKRRNLVGLRPRSPMKAVHQRKRIGLSG